MNKPVLVTQLNYHIISNCWQIMLCGREPGGTNADELGVCIAAKEEMGHSCWAIAGTLCGGEVQGSTAQKIGVCTCCAIYKLYNRSTGAKGQDVIDTFPDEERRYQNIQRRNTQTA
ncbi:MAG: hypothetical protein OEL66_08325 [Desulfobulbaceae bacterium]|nr:hypothetical protein [Desulfobulbaceae bacterium]